MQRWLKQALVLGASVAIFLLVGAAVGRGEDKVLVEWKFDKDLCGWEVGGLVADAAIRDGALHGKPTGSDPILFGPKFEIAATPLQYVEMCVRSSAPAPGELFWTETFEGNYGGFSQEKYRSFHTEGDGQFHVYRMWPYWHAAKKIIRLRLDPPNAGEFDIKWVRIAEQTVGESASASVWKGDEVRKQWRRSGDIEETADGPIAWSPLLSIAAGETPFVCVRLATHRAGSGRLFSVSSRDFGWESVPFPLRADGNVHSYNIPTSNLGNWHDKIIRLGLQLPSGPGASIEVESIEVAAEPKGPAELEVAYFGTVEGINRAGRPCGITCTIRNLGGEIAENVTATLEVPQGVQIVDGAVQHLERLSLDLPRSVAWHIQADQLGSIPLTVKVTSAGPATASASGSVELTKAPEVAKGDYIPEPRPVRSKYEIGAFYFPGFPTADKWQPIRNYPNRKPILGWYDETNPECADWQIKWAVEHGINFFMVDWYWCQGNRQLEHWVQNAYGKARFRKYLKWAVMWANHNPPNTHSAEDWRKVTQYWIDHCFNMPEYYRIDNRPAVFIWAPQNVRGDLGGSAEAAKLYAMSQEMAKAAGYPGIYFVAMSSHDNPDRAKELSGEGYEGATTYHGFQLAWQRSKSDRFPFSALLDTCPELWRDAEKSAAGLNYLPVVDTGWDARPWHGEKTLVAYGRTPEMLGKLCKLARQYADEKGKKIIALGPMNEWGEGSYIEPYAEYGFQDLDQVRAAFCEPGDWPPNLTPADIGRGPYDLPAVVAKNAWDFNGEGAREGWDSNGDVADLVAKDGQLQGRATGRDPVLQVTGLQVEADRLHRLKFRMRCDRSATVQVFWSTTLVPMNGEMSLGLEVAGDGQFHDYEIDLAKNPKWRGLVNAFRLDPGSEPGTQFALDYVRLE